MAGLAAISLAATALAGTACTRKGPRDVGNENPRSVFVDGPLGTPPRRAAEADAGPRSVAQPTVTGPRPRVIANAASRAIALGPAQVFYGSAEDDALFSVPKAGGEPTRLARRAPIAGALSFDVTTSVVAWIGSPGDVVLRIPMKGGAVGTVRDRGIFTDVVADRGDVFFSEAQGPGGSLGRVTGNTAAMLASFPGSPRGLCVEGDTVYVATTTHLVATTRTRGEIRELASGGSFASPLTDGAWLYATSSVAHGHGRALVRVKAAGGELETVVREVREAPIAIHDGTLYWFAADRPALLAGKPGAAPRTISEDAQLERPQAIAVDRDGAFVATGDGEGGRIVSLASSAAPASH